jgi:16S rRNA (guanine527-N7)-methyltransferase
MNKVLSYFPELDSDQIEKLRSLYDAYKYWNEKINVISRKDFHNFYLHHVLHSLAISKIAEFKPGTKILDVGTGGGFPGVPLAIKHPHCHFVLLDSIKKKLKVIEEIKKEINLSNVETVHARVEKYKEQFDFITSRAVTQFPKFINWVKDNIKDEHNNSIRNGIIYLKGGDFKEEINQYKNKVQIFSISEFFTEKFFETKKIIYLPF